MAGIDRRIHRWQAYVHLDSRRGQAYTEMPGVARRAPTSALVPARLRMNSIFYGYIYVRAPLQLSHRGVLGVLPMGCSRVIPS